MKNTNLAKILFQPCLRRYCSIKKQNLLSLRDRGLISAVSPETHEPDLQRLLSARQSLYCGFDPTADSLHVGHLLPAVLLLHASRNGHKSIALVGGATARIGDPSGKNSDRDSLALTVIEQNVQGLMTSLQRLHDNYNENFMDSKSKRGDFIVLNNADWYKNLNIIDFMANVGRHFRLNRMLSKESVKSRLSDGGMRFSEFTYQMFQAFDWLQLYKEHKCTIQVGGHDQLGNITAGHEYVHKITRKQVYGLTVPLITTESGQKLGKTEGNAIWLNADKTSHYHLYQYFLNTSDNDVGWLLRLLTFLPDAEVDDLILKHKKQPQNYYAQQRLAEQVLLLVRGKTGLEVAKRCTAALWSGDISSLSSVTPDDLMSSVGVSAQPVTRQVDMTLRELVLHAGIFNRDVDAERVIREGGMYVNQQRVTEPDQLLLPDRHILSNGLTLLRRGKKHFCLVQWT